MIGGGFDDASTAVTIRFARPEDLDALRRLIELDGRGGGTRHMLLDLTRPGASPRVLVALMDGEPIAARHVDSGHEASHPFRRSAAALELLRTRAEQLQAVAPPPRGRLGWLTARLSPR